jgi:ribosomal-protein-alanine N-acetyltransferase
MPIRPATEADLAQLAAIGESADFSAHWTTQQWLDIFHTEIPARLAWVAEDVREGENHACGFLVAQSNGPEWELENIAVLPQFRSRGLGRELLNDLLAAARQQGAERIFLEVRESNDAAIRLYQATGFQLLSRRHAYYLNPPEDALIMVHTL